MEESIMNNTKFTALTAEEMTNIDGGVNRGKIRAGLAMISAGVHLLIDGIFH